jgi:asparagine synthase (glutamine-hydrolysing)
MLYIDSKTWLPDDLLIKADKISMANSLELRVPFLDHKVMEFAASLPPNFKVKGTTTKRILKKAFSKSIPAEIVHRKKTGFPVPYEKWLQNELKDYCLDILHDDHSLNSQLFGRNLFRDPVNLQVMDYHAKDLFSLLILELWYNRFIKNY